MNKGYNKTLTVARLEALNQRCPTSFKAMGINRVSTPQESDALPLPW